MSRGLCRILFLGTLPGDLTGRCHFPGKLMCKSIRRLTAVLGVALVVGPVWSRDDKPTEKPMTTRAAGTFVVKLDKQPLADKDADPMLARMSIDKKFSGDLEATSRGEMLSAGTVAKGSAGYVAIERVSGKLGGRSGTFVLQHSGTMNRGKPTLSVTVVPDSGTGDLTGLTGSMTIDISGGKHSYQFEYTLPTKP